MGMSNGSPRGLLSDINVTPLVDVMLVLLIIFMVTAPMMTKGVPVNLPETTAKSLPQKKEHTEVIVTKEGNIYIDGIPADETSLKKQLKLSKEKDGSKQVLLRADKDVSYGLVVKVMAAIREAGINNLGLVTAPEKVSPPQKLSLKK